jgi:CheY-like chemotaxis protein
MDRPSSASSHPTVLYVEDNPVNILLMRAVFDQMPEIELVVATTGREAIGSATGLHPVLLILDVHLPDCHGSQLLHVLKLLPGCEGVAAVAATADSEFDIAGSGFDELWAKPLDLQFVMRRVREYADAGRADPLAPRHRTPPAPAGAERSSRR